MPFLYGAAGGAATRGRKMRKVVPSPSDALGTNVTATLPNDAIAGGEAEAVAIAFRPWW